MWNLYSAIRDREYGFFTGHGINELRARLYTQNFFGSRFLMDRMQHRELLSRRELPISCLTFSPDGDIICATFGNRLLLYDWEVKKVHNMFTAAKFQSVCEMICRKCTRNELEVIFAGSSKLVRRAYVSPNGFIRFSTVFVSGYESPKFAIAPEDTNEIIVGSAFGALHRADLRLAHQSHRNDRITTIRNSRGNSVIIKGIAHHPFNQEICVYGNDNRMHVFDKRNYGTPLKRILIGSEDNDSDISVYQCSYNYNGSAFLANSSFGAYVIKNNDEGVVIKFLDNQIRSCFVGPKSNFIVSIESCSKFMLYDISKEEIVQHETVAVGARGCLDLAHRQHIVQPHPEFPVIATVSCSTGVGIWSPPNIMFTNNTNRISDSP